MIQNGTIVTVLLVVVGVGLSAFGAWHAYDRETRATLDEFESDVHEQLRALEREIEMNLEVISSLRALHDVSPAMDRRQFGVFARQALERHGGILALEWVPRVRAAEREAYEEAARRDGHETFRITEITSAGGRTPAGERPEYYPVFFVAPHAGNESALGYDLASDPTRREALERAREQRTMQATAPVILIQDPSEQYGFLVLLPVHRDAELAGFIVGVYRVSDIFRAALGDAAEDVELLLVDAGAGDLPIYRHASASFTPATPPIEQRRRLAVAGRVWRVVASPGGAYFVARSSWVPQLGFVLGLLLTAALAAYVRVSSSRALAVKRLVNERTRDLLEVNEQLEQQRNILQSILDNLGDGVAVADETGTLSMFNPAAERILGLGMIESGPEAWSGLYGLFRPDMSTPIPIDELPLARAVAGEESRDVDIFVRNPERPGGVFIRVTATPLEHRDGAPRGGVAVFRDVSERKWAEAVLRDSEARFRAIVEATASALIILSPEGLVREFNPQAETIFGVTRGEALGRNFLDLCIPAGHREAVSAEIRGVLAGSGASGMELPLEALGVPERTLLWSFSRLAESEAREAVVIATGHDITVRRQAEAARRVRELANRLQAARESERAHLAREIHDELGQALTGLKYEVSFVSRQIAEHNPAMRERLEGVGRLIDDTIVSLKRIAADLRPLILDELGLFQAIRWLAREFEKRTRTACDVELPESEPEWTRDRSTAVFRILQEALTNVARHAEASRVEVRVRLEEGAFVLEVCDNGRGITVDQARAWESFGLLSMQERAAMFGGTLEIRPAEPKGTYVKVGMPY